MNKTLADRYADKIMVGFLCEETKYLTWRSVWLALAKCQRRLGANISNEDLDAVTNSVYKEIDFDRVKEIEKETHHDVVAHLKYWAEVEPAVGRVVHLGATSSFVTDNAGAMIQRAALENIIINTKELCKLLCDLSLEFADSICVGYTHFQPAQPTTIGKRISTWLRDLYEDCASIENWDMQCRGIKGTTGTQSSQLYMFNGDHDIVKTLDKMLAEELGFGESVSVSGQTSPRRDEVYICDFLSRIATTLNKMGNDLRLMAHTGIVREGFSKSQVGSSAMPYKKNPMLSERLCSLSRMVPQYRNMMVDTAASQWLERSLDDSAVRRVAMTDIFLTLSGALETAKKIARSFDVDDSKRLEEFGKYRGYFCSEFVILNAVHDGYDRQKIHELLREHMVNTENSDEFLFSLNSDDFLKCYVYDFTDEQLVGRARQQTVEYVESIKHLFR